jgi:putative transposase
VYHVYHRAIEGLSLFESPRDYAALERLMGEVAADISMRLLAYSLMPNHWHLQLWPYKDRDLSRFMHRLSMTHAKRWRSHRETTGRGHVYQSRYGCVAVEIGDPVNVIARYIERNALTANLVDRAEDWRWCSLWRRLHPEVVEQVPTLCEWPVGRRPDWLGWVNCARTPKEFASVERALEKGIPFGSQRWQVEAAKRLGLVSKLQPRGRPRAAARRVSC